MPDNSDSKIPDPGAEKPSSEEAPSGQPKETGDVPANSATGGVTFPTTAGPPDVPVFNCVVYIRRASGGVQLRVGNLDGITAEALNERAGLAAIVKQFKQVTAEYLENDGTIPWIDPIPPPEADEVSRFLPVHL